MIVKRSGGRAVVTAVNSPVPDCAGAGGTFRDRAGRWVRLRVDRRGRFAGRARRGTDGIAAVRGRFVGRRPRLALLQARWRGGCVASMSFRMRRVRRVAVRDGWWSGTLASGGAIRFEVVNEGREVFAPELSPSPWFRCSDGSAGRIAHFVPFTWQGWVRRSGRFDLTALEGDNLFTAAASFKGSEASGSLRGVQTWPDGRGACDTGAVAFSARFSHP